MDSLDGADDLAEARSRILAAARHGTPRATLAMLEEALVQLEEISPPLSGEVWEAYAAVADATGDDPQSGARVVPFRRQTPSR